MDKKIIIGAVIVLAIIVSLAVVWFNVTNIPSPEGRMIVKQSGGGQSMLIAECKDPSYIENTSDYIIEGKIEKAESKWNTERNFIYTYSDFTIEKYIKGEPLEYNKIQIITEGGCVGGICQGVEDSPTMDTGKKRLYLTKSNGEFKIHGCGGIRTLESVPLSQSDCTKNEFSMAFILVANTRSELTSERINKLNSIKNIFSNEFRSATNGLARMDTSYSVFTISREDLTEYSVETISRKFYETNPDTFDFISIYAVNGAGSARQTGHEPAQNKINGIGVQLYDRTADFGSKGKLLGINYEKDIDILSGTGSLLHETGHQWCCFVGENFVPDNTPLGIIQQSMHFFSGLESPYQCNTPMGAGYWIANGDGTYKRSKECNGPEKYHPFQLYFMGLYNQNNFDFSKKLTIYYADTDMNSKAIPYKQVDINNIIRVEGQRNCQANTNSLPPAVPPKIK